MMTVRLVSGTVSPICLCLQNTAGGGDNGPRMRRTWTRPPSDTTAQERSPVVDQRHMSTEFLPPASVPAPSTPAVAAGWYPDPQGMGQRYWDGRQWTQHVAPLGPPPVVKDDVSGVGGYVVSVLLPVIGFIVGIVWLAKGRGSQGLLCMVLSVVSFLVWSALLYGGA
jgi:Protein of unknown function (DUF2510)